VEFKDVEFKDVVYPEFFKIDKRIKLEHNSLKKSTNLKPILRGIPIKDDGYERIESVEFSYREFGYSIYCFGE
jgi:hypothetical protein